MNNTNPITMASNCLIFILLLQFLGTISFATTTSNNATTSPHKIPAFLVFGDSSVDTGNNNYVPTFFRGNHRPYGHDFPGRIPTGRFSNGKLVPDFMASMLGLKETIPPFLQPDLSDEELVTGVSFASAGTGLDELTSIISGVIPMAKQVDYLAQYIESLDRIVGRKEAQRILAEALVIVSVGTNDFIFNFYDIPTRKLQFSISDYQDFLQDKLGNFIQELYQLGCRKFMVSGLPPIGCLPIQMTAKLSLLRRCLNTENSDACSYNDKLLKLLAKSQNFLPGSKILYADGYTPLIDMIQNPQNYGFVETRKGCCGTGMVEAGPLCNEETPVCDSPSKFIFWDTTHPAESTYRYLSEKLVKELLPKFS